MGTMASRITGVSDVCNLFRCRSRKTSKLSVTGLCEGDSPVTSEFPAQKGSVARKRLPFDDVIVELIWWLCRGTAAPDRCTVFLAEYTYTTSAWIWHVPRLKRVLSNTFSSGILSQVIRKCARYHYQLLLDKKLVFAMWTASWIYLSDLQNSAHDVLRVCNLHRICNFNISWFSGMRKIYRISMPWKSRRKVNMF